MGTDREEPETDRTEAFEPGDLNWISFDHLHGKLTCRRLNAAFEESTGTILENRLVRVLADSDGTIICASSDRVIADRGRPGRECKSCEDRTVGCARRWRVSWRDVDSGLLFAHTLSQTGSLNFRRYATALLGENIAPGQVLTRIYIEEAKRQKTGTLYRRLQFERVDPFAH